MDNEFMSEHRKRILAQRQEELLRQQRTQLTALKLYQVTTEEERRRAKKLQEATAAFLRLDRSGDPAVRKLKRMLQELRDQSR